MYSSSWICPSTEAICSGHVVTACWIAMNYDICWCIVAPLPLLCFLTWSRCDCWSHLVTLWLLAVLYINSFPLVPTITAGRNISKFLLCVEAICCGHVVTACSIAIVQYVISMLQVCHYCTSHHVLVTLWLQATTTPSHSWAGRSLHDVCGHVLTTC